MKTHFYTQDIIDVCDNKHLTVDEIFEYISKKHPTAWKSSIYRNVEELAEKWNLKKVLGASKKTYFEKTRSEHIHLVDEETGKCYAKMLNKDRSGRFTSNEIVENPSLTLWQSIIDRNKNRRSNVANKQAS